MKTIHAQKPLSAFVGALLAAMVFCMPASAEEDLRYTMTVISDAAQGSKVRTGNYDRAIRRITGDGSAVGRNFADHVNLCVAYAQTRDLEKADLACNAALAKLERRESRVTRDRSKGNLRLQQYQSDLALALSNRGVLLAITGEEERARKDFAAAIELKTRLSRIAKTNLARLEQSTLPDA